MGSGELREEVDMFFSQSSENLDLGIDALACRVLQLKFKSINGLGFSVVDPRNSNLRLSSYEGDCC